MALVAYRHLLRSIRITFQGSSSLRRSFLSRYLKLYLPIPISGDAPVLRQAQTTVRESFQKNAGLRNPELAPAIAHAEEVAAFLKGNVVQGKQVEEGSEKYSK